MSSGKILSLEEVECQILDQLIPDAKELRFDATCWEHNVPVSLYMAALESAFAVVVVAKYGLKVQAYALLRQLYEIVIELKLIGDDRTHVQCFRLRSEENKLRKLTRARDGNPYFAMIGEMKDLAEHIETTENEIAALKASGAESLKIMQRFERAGGEADYEGVYHALCDQTHVSASALMDRYFQLRDNRIEIRAFHNEGDDSFEALRSTVCELLDIATNSVNAALE